MSPVAWRATSADPLPIPGTRDFTLEDVGPGWEVFSRDRTYVGDVEPELRDPVGGLCVEVIHPTVADPETGELTERTCYRCLIWRGRQPVYEILDSGEVDLSALYGVNRFRAFTSFCRLLQPIVTSNRRAPRAADDQPVDDAIRLWRVLW